MFYFCYITKVNAKMKDPIVSVLFLLCGSENTFISVLILGIQEYKQSYFGFLSNVYIYYTPRDNGKHIVLLYKRVKG